MSRLLIGVLMLVQAAVGAPAALDRTEIDAAGPGEAILTVPEAGRYSIECKSEQGVALGLVDRMVGPRGAGGQAGTRDGRIDAFFDAGTYKVVTTPPANAKGRVALAVHAFDELNSPLPVLLEHTSARATLGDRQKISYWIVLTEKKTVYLEAQGRALADMRLWHEGSWLVAVSPTAHESAVDPERPLGTQKLVATLEPGHYLLTAYGGAPRAWARDAADHPLRVRYGIVELDPVTRMRAAISDFGVDRYLVAQEATEFALEAADKKDFRLDVKDFAIGDPLASGGGDSATISPRSQEPRCTVSHRSRKKYSLVSVAGPRGEPYVLDAHTVGLSPQWYRQKTGAFWIASMAKGSADEIDVTGILTADVPGKRHTEVVAADVIHLARAKRWARRFNLLGRESVFFEVEEAGDYTVTASGLDARFRFEPFQTSRPLGYKPPGFRSDEEPWALEKGYWQLTFDAATKGVLTVEVKHQDAEDAGAAPPAKLNCQFPRVMLDGSTSYALHQSGSRHASALIRPHPLSLAQALPVVLEPEQQLDVPFTTAGDGVLVVTSSADDDLTCAVDGASFLATRALAAGPHVIRLRNAGRKALEASLKHLPASQAPDAKPVHLAPEVTFAKLPVLAVGTPIYLDFEREAEHTALLQVDSPANYVIETTGLLRTACTVRTRTQPRLWANQEGGTGRNCRLIQYLRPGEYQVAVRTLGKSMGRAGLLISRTPVIDGGVLPPGSERRESVRAGSAVQYTLPVAAPGKFRVKTIGINQTFACRLEDQDGWPIAPVATDADIEIALPAGAYRYMSLPGDVDSVRASLVEPVQPDRVTSGRGPHVLHLDEALANVWREPAEGRLRARDVYDVTVPATVDAVVDLGQPAMQAYLVDRRAPPPGVVAIVPPKKGWRGKLGPGDYRLEVESSRPDDGVEYTVQVSANQLVDGGRREVTVPATVPLSVGAAGTVELASQGRLDVRARLYTEAGALVATSDDAGGNWNFRIARALEAGLYALKVEAVGAQEGSTTVSMKVPGLQRLPPVAAPYDAKLALEGKSNVLRIAVPAGAGLVSVRAVSGSLLDAALRTSAGALATAHGKTCAFDVPMTEAQELELVLASADHLDETAHLTVSLATPASRTPDELAKGLDSARLVQLAIDRPGTFRVRPVRDLALSDGLNRALATCDGELVSLAAGITTLAWAGDPGRVQLERVAIAPAEPVELAVGPGPARWIDVAPGEGSIGLLLAEPDQGSPGCALVAPGDETPALSRACERFDGGSLAVGLPGATRATLWSTGAGGVSDSRVKLKLFAIPAAEVERALDSGDNPGNLEPAARARFALEPGPKHLALALERGLAAFTWDGTAVADVVSAVAGARTARVPSTATHLAIVDLGGRGGRYAVTVLRALDAPAPSALTAQAPFERVLTEPTALRLDVNPGAAAELRVAGDVAATFVDATGAVREGTRFPLDARPGYLLLRGGPGLVKAWIAGDERDLAPRWGRVETPEPKPVADGAVLPLAGTTARFELTGTAPRVLHVETDRAAVAGLTAEDGRFLDVVESTSGCRFDHLLAPGRYRVLVRGLAGASLAGTVRFGFTEVTSLREGAGPEGLLGGGASRTFSFAVPARRPVGIGIRAARDALSCQLLTADEERIGEGLQQLATLEAGTYLLRVSAAPGLEPVRFTPVVVGLEPPGLGPPDDYVRAFLNSIGVDGEGN